MRRPVNARAMPLRPYTIRRACGCGDVVYAPITTTPKRLDAAASKLTHEERVACFCCRGAQSKPVPLYEFPRLWNGAAGASQINARLEAAILRWRDRRAKEADSAV